MNNVKIVVVGAGGTGGNLVTNLCRLIEPIKDKSIEIIVADGDHIEGKNRERQPYSLAEVGQNKAQRLVYKCSHAFNVNISSYPHYIEDIDTLKRLFTNTTGHNYYSNSTPILIGAVDNNKARALFHEFFNQAYNLFYIDGGNETWDGQVVCGVRGKGKTLAPPVAELYPDILKNIGVFKSQLSCTEVVQENPQQFITNLQVAVIILSYLSDIIITEDLISHQTAFDIKLKAMRGYDAPWAEHLQRKIG